MGTLRALRLALVLLAFGQAAQGTAASATVSNLTLLSGDRSVVLHWDGSAGESAGYHIYRSTSPTAPSPARLTLAPVRIRSYADVTVTNGQTYFYAVRPSKTGEGVDGPWASATPAPFKSDAEFLEYLQHTAFDYFWYESDPATGLVRDRSDPASPCSIAAVGFGLSALGIGADHGWITRSQAATRALATLRTFWEGPQNDHSSGAIGYRGWFYHFLEMRSGTRAGRCELSSIDTALLLAGVLDAKQFFDGNRSDEASIRRLADAIFARVDWAWMAHDEKSLTHGWSPETGFIPHRWIGYNEAMILYLLGLGADTKGLPAAHWDTWTSGYRWQTNQGAAYVSFGPLFGHQYSHCWVDFRNTADAYLRAKGMTYFENSRRATLAQRAYAIANPGHFAGYSSNLWGFSACDGPGAGGSIAYRARGAPPGEEDDGTIAPTAVAGSLAFAPEVSLPALRYMYDQFLVNIWTGYGFRDGFNLQASWWGPHVLGIDQGPILIMTENYRFGRVWKRFMRNPEIQRGMQAAGFIQSNPTPGAAKAAPLASVSVSPPK